MAGEVTLKPGWLHEDVERAAERVRRGFPTPREYRYEETLRMIADAQFDDGGEQRGLKWCQDLAREVLTGLAQSSEQ